MLCNLAFGSYIPILDQIHAEFGSPGPKNRFSVLKGPIFGPFGQYLQFKSKIPKSEREAPRCPPDWPTCQVWASGSENSARDKVVHTAIYILPWTDARQLRCLYSTASGRLRRPPATKILIFINFCRKVVQADRGSLQWALFRRRSFANRLLSPGKCPPP